MAGLLSDVLPYLYSQGDRLKRHAKGLLADPAGTMAQTAGLLGDKHREQQGLMAQAFADPKAPFRVTDDAAMMQAAQAMLNGPLGMAPAGITAWHGSPHIFDKFDSSKIGTGEGAQAYGHGLYLAENPGVAQAYKEQLGAGRGASPDDVAARILDAAGGDGVKAAAIARQRAQYANVPGGKERLEAIAQKLESGVDPRGHLYKVDLPDDAIAKMLDWDKPLSQQSKAVQNAFAKHPLVKESADHIGRFNSGSVDPFYDMLSNTFGGQRQASDALRQAGIPGIRYLDGGSRGAGDGTRNFVVFPGEESILKILERNGQPLR